MALTDRIWDALATVIRMNDKVERLAELARLQHARIEDLTARVIRLETALEIAMSGQVRRLPPGNDS